MDSFEDATHRAQIARLRQLAEAALAQYDVQVDTFSTILHLENTTFRVDSGANRYVLRINRPDHRSEQEIRSEAMWLAAIRDDTELVVPEPVANVHGDFVTRASADDVPEERCCVLFRWVEGQFYRSRLSPVALERVGRFTAHLHNHAQAFKPGPAFWRRSVEFGTEEEEGEMLRLVRKGFEDGAAIIAPQDLATFTMARHHLQTAIADLGHSQDWFGLIHADLHHGNYLFHKQEVRAVDFDDCGWGHFLYDLAVTQWYLQARPDYEALCAAHIHGYRSIRPLSEEELSWLPTFRAARTLVMGMYMAGRSDNPKLRERAPQFVAQCAGALRDYLVKNTGYMS